MADPAELVVDASVIVDLLAGTTLASAARHRLGGVAMHAPAHLDIEVLSALGRLHRARRLSARQVEAALDQLARAPVTRHPLPDLIGGAWTRRTTLRLADAAYVELAEQLGIPLLTSDQRLGRVYRPAELLRDGWDTPRASAVMNSGHDTAHLPRHGARS